jgi:hypothetical protein
MFADADHEVIDSPAALFRHLSEEHGVEEARDLDPDSAPLQFWLRRHADLERAQRAARRQPDPPPDPATHPGPEARSPAQRPPEPEPRSSAQRPPEPGARSSGRRGRESERRPSAQRGRSGAPGRAEAGREPAPPFPPAGGRGPGRPDGAGAGRDGRRHAGFGDPVVEAMARALAGRGYDEAVVRSAIRSFAAEGRGPSGEAAVRAVFVEPMLQWAAEHLLDAPGTSRPAAGSGPFPVSERRQPAPTPQRPQPAPAAPARAAAARPEPAPTASARSAPAAVEPAPAAPTRAAPTAVEPEADPAPASRPRREEPVRPEAAWAVLWADLADSGRRPDEAAGSGGDDGDDLMAVANAVQARRRVRLLRR